jgi:hypothetical protein
MKILITANPMKKNEEKVNVRQPVHTSKLTWIFWTGTNIFSRTTIAEYENSDKFLESEGVEFWSKNCRKSLFYCEKKNNFWKNCESWILGK